MKFDQSSAIEQFMSLFFPNASDAKETAHRYVENLQTLDTEDGEFGYESWAFLVDELSTAKVALSVDWKDSESLVYFLNEIAERLEIPKWIELEEEMIPDAGQMVSVFEKAAALFPEKGWMAVPIQMDADEYTCFFLPLAQLPRLEASWSALQKENLIPAGYHPRRPIGSFQGW